MNRYRLLIILLVFFFLPLVPGNSQFTPDEVSQWKEIEEFLQTAEIVRFEDVGEGVTAPVKLYLKKGDVERKGVWKNPSGKQMGFLEGWQYEVAAFRLDKLLELNMVPPTVEREFKGKRGSLQFWAESKYSLLKIMEQKIPFPASEQHQLDNMKYMTRAWDSLIANEDRTQQNILYTEDWRTILIDHSRSFRSSKKFTENLMFGKNGIQKSADGRPFLFRRLPRIFLEKVKSLTFEGIQQAVGPYLDDNEIKAILARKTLLLKEIDDMIKEQGEEKVLY